MRSGNQDQIRSGRVFPPDASADAVYTKEENNDYNGRNSKKNLFLIAKTVLENSGRVKELFYNCVTAQTFGKNPVKRRSDKQPMAIQAFPVPAR